MLRLKAKVFFWRISICGVLLGAYFSSINEPCNAQEKIRATTEQSAKLEEKAIKALKDACRFFREHVSERGGYPYFSSKDGTSQWGENERLIDAAIVQPPGTPSIGTAFLQAYKATDDEEYLTWATEIGDALVQGQLKSGGWAQVIYFEKPEQGRMGDYRKRSGGEWNQSSLDDNQTQAALLFLIELDKALEFKNVPIHECTLFALDALLKAQFSNGGFPQGWRGPSRSIKRVLARYPNYDWKSEGKVKNYWDYPTLNDGLVGDVAEVLILALEVYSDEKFLVALKRLGDFVLAAQMPEPQPAWCQQYNDNMQPIWARKFEPPAIASVESQDAMFTLIRIAEITMETHYMVPVPRCIEYFRNKCTLADGRLARFYELKTNKPLYMDRQYQLTYDDSNVPTHYGWKAASRIDAIEKRHDYVARGQIYEQKVNGPSEEVVKDVIEAIDSDGIWSHQYAGEKLMGSPKFKLGEVYVSSAEFVKNVKLLSDFIQAAAIRKREKQS